MKKTKSIIVLSVIMLCVILAGCHGKETVDNAGENPDTAAQSEAAEESDNKTVTEDKSVSKEETISEDSDEKIVSLEEDFIANVGGMYTYLGDDEIEQRDCEIRMIDGRNYIEYLGVYDYAGAEIEVNGKSSDSDLNHAEYDVTLHPFSGFSYAGNYWGIGDKCVIKTSDDGIEITNDPFVGKGTLSLKKSEKKCLHQSEAGAQHNKEFIDFWGSWRCTSKKDDETHYIYLELSPEGTITVVDKVPEYPPNIYLGNYFGGKTSDGIKGDILCEQFAYGEMPIEWTLQYDDKLKCPVIIDEYYKTEPFTNTENGSLAFEKTYAGPGAKIACGPGAMSQDKTYAPQIEDIQKLEDAIVIFPIWGNCGPGVDISSMGVDVITNWAVLTDGNAEYAGLVFEEGDGKTPIHLDYPGIDPGDPSSYIRTDKEKLEAALDGFFNTDSKLPEGKYYDYVIDDYVTVWGMGYYVSYEGISIEWSDFKHSIDEDNLIISATRTTSDFSMEHAYDYRFTFEYNEKSPYKYSLINCEITDEYHDTSYSQDVLTSYEKEIRNYVNNEADASDKVELKAGTDGCDYARTYYYQGDELVFAYYYNSLSKEVDNRYYFWNGCMLEWIEGNGNDDANRKRHYASDSPRDSRWEETAKRILNEAKAYK